jgi:cytochrome c-type biogenesis protein
MAFSSAQLGKGVLLLSAYSLGMAVPFLLAALGIGRASGLLRRHTRAIRVVSIAAGMVMVVIGVMLVTGTLGRLSQYGALIDLGL